MAHRDTHLAHFGNLAACYGMIFAVTHNNIKENFAEKRKSIAKNNEGPEHNFENGRISKLN